MTGAVFAPAPRSVETVRVSHDEVVDCLPCRDPRKRITDEVERLCGDRSARQGRADRRRAEASFAGEVGGRPSSADHFEPQPSSVHDDAHGTSSRRGPLWMRAPWLFLATISIQP